MELQQLQQQPELAPAAAHVPLPSACLLGCQHSPRVRHMPLMGHDSLQPANGELRVTWDPWVETGGGICGHCLSPWGREETHRVFRGLSWAGAGRTPGCGAIQANLQPPIAGTGLPSETWGSRRAGAPLPVPAPGHAWASLHERCQNSSVECLGVGAIASSSSPQKVLAGQSQPLCQPHQHGSGLAKPLRYTSPPLTLLQALAVSDHYPVEVKLTA